MRSLTNFALADYAAAYRDALAALADGDVWDWTTVRSLYRSAGEYTAQYRALEDYVSANPNAARTAFLFAYHNLMLGNNEAARREFGHVAAIDPANEAARRLSTGERPPQPGHADSGNSAGSRSKTPLPAARRGRPAAGTAASTWVNRRRWAPANEAEMKTERSKTKRDIGPESDLSCFR